MKRERDRKVVAFKELQTENELENFLGYYRFFNFP